MFQLKLDRRGYILFVSYKIRTMRKFAAQSWAIITVYTVVQENGIGRPILKLSN